MATTPEAYVHLSTDKTTLTFYYDTLRADRKGIKCGIRNRKDYRDPSPLEWSDDDYDWRGAPHIYARTAVFDASFRDFCPTTTAKWFQFLQSLKIIEGLEHLNTSQVADMSGMFFDCSSLTTLDLSSFDTLKVRSMSWMFSGCESLTTLDLSRFDTSEVMDMSDMFRGCSSLTDLDLTCFDTSEVTNMSRMFNDCESLTTIYSNSSWSCRCSNHMFSGCNSLRGTATNVGKSFNVSMANPETGYFTKKEL